jgi:ACS family glucarate transporter-like MFS transporter
MNVTIPAPSLLEKPTQVRYGVLAFACSLSMITYLDRVCFGTVAKNIQEEFGLSETQKGWLFSAFALAYAAFEVPSGWLGDVFGPRKTLIRIVLWWSFFTALTGLIYPQMVGAFTLLFLVRFLFGMGEAGAYPNIARAFHNWFPFQERGFAKGAVWMAGRFAGGVTPLIVFALLYEETDAAGVKVIHWRHMFWIFGSLGAAWCVLFWMWFRDRPEQKATVNQAEIALIQQGEIPHAAGFRVPWAKILGNWNLGILCLMYFCAAYGWYLNITYLPGLLKDYYGVTYTEKWTPDFWRTSLMTGMPLLMGSVACLLGGLATDFFIRKTGNRKWGRRLFGVVGHSLCALCYFSGLLVDSAWGIVLAISFASFCNDLTMGAAWASCLDIGKRYSGIVAGCMNTVGNLGGFTAGFLTGWILDLYKTGDAPVVIAASHKLGPGWTVNFIIFGSVYVLATILWFFFDATKPVAPEERG